MVLLGLTLFDCGTCHIMLFGSEMLVQPTWEADHLITKYKLTFIRNMYPQKLIPVCIFVLNWWWPHELKDNNKHIYQGSTEITKGNYENPFWLGFFPRYMEAFYICRPERDA